MIYYFLHINKEVNMTTKMTKPIFITQAAMVAAVYVVLTLIFAPISFSEVQVRISEALTILPFFTPAAVPGLFIGCIIANGLGGAILPDIIFGSIATLLGAIGTYLLRKNRWLAPLPPIISNAIIVPFILKYGYGIPLPLPLLMLFIAVGEILSCYLLGEILLTVLEKYRKAMFGS